MAAKTPLKAKHKKKAAQQPSSSPLASSTLDIEEVCAIGDYKRGYSERLAKWFEKQRDKPLSRMLHAFLLDLIRGKKFRKRGQRKDRLQHREKQRSILFAVQAASVNASSTKEALWTAKEWLNQRWPTLSFKQIEKVYYAKCRAAVSPKTASSPPSK